MWQAVRAGLLHSVQELCEWLRKDLLGIYMFQNPLFGVLLFDARAKLQVELPWIYGAPTHLQRQLELPF